MSVLRLTFLIATIAFLTPVLPAAARTATVSGISRIYLRSGPATTYNPNGVVAAGEAVTTIEQVGNWFRVQTADGRTGFIYAGYLTFAPSLTPPPPTVSAAEPAALATAERPTAEAPTDESLRAELASMKAEIARLRSEVGGPTADASSERASAAALMLPTRVPVEIAPNSPEATNLRTVGVAVFFLVVGWIFGASFARRRGRSQRGRLRF